MHHDHDASAGIDATPTSKQSHHHLVTGTGTSGSIARYLFHQREEIKGREVDTDTSAENHLHRARFFEISIVRRSQNNDDS